MVDRVEFEIEVPGDEGEKIKSTDLNDEQYELAVHMQAIQNQVNNLAASVNEFNMKKDHFRLKQKELMDLLESQEDGS